MDLSLKKIIYNISKLTGMEFAVFDADANLVSSTELYLKYKGRNVHANSINEVLNEGNLIVNKPGYMKSCIGCRFANNCPSTIEILSCIRVDSISIGVISLTSFSKEKHHQIENDIHQYMDILKNTTSLISIFAQNETNKFRYSIQNTIIDNIVDMQQQNLLVVDINGIVTNCSDSINRMFSTCQLYTNYIEQILPIDIVNWILNSKTSGKNYVSSQSFTGNITTNPIIYDDAICGFIISLNPQTSIKSSKIKDDYLDRIVSRNLTIEGIKSKIKKINNSSSSVLITGETGTGKEMVAKAIHFSSNRKSKPFIPINCSSIPEGLFESELFGYEEGSFTGSKRGGKVGLFEVANGGTIFLDEIGELPTHLQSKLLRVIQEKSIKRVGSLSFIPVDIRIISATNQNLDEMMYDGIFREDLYYRLKVIPIELPTLKQRIEDIEPLSMHFLEKYNRQLNKNIFSISDNTFMLLKSYHWPGNIRELQNVLEYAVNMEEDSTLNPDNLPEYIKKYQSNPIDINRTILQGEMDLILSTIDKYGWTVEGKKMASTELGISLRTLYRKLEKIKI